MMLHFVNARNDKKKLNEIKKLYDEAFPRVLLARRMVKDRARYFGPYTSSQAVRDTIDLIHKLYHVRSCNRNLPRDTGKERPCLNYHIRTNYLMLLIDLNCRDASIPTVRQMIQQH